MNSCSNPLLFRMEALTAGGRGLGRTLRPLPQARRDFPWQPLPEGPGHQHDLSPVMPLVRDEIAKDVPHIQWQVAPHVGSGRRDRPAVLTSELQQAGDAVAAAPQRGQELPRSDPVPIDRAWDRESVWLAEDFDPHTAGIVHVSGDHADRATGRPRHGGSPEAGRQVLEKEEGDAIVGPPAG